MYSNLSIVKNSYLLIIFSTRYYPIILASHEQRFGAN